MTRYRVLGHPLGMSFVELQNHGVGEEFEADMDPGVEQLLTGAGAIVVLEEPPKPKAAPKPAPKAEAPKEEKAEVPKVEAPKVEKAEVKRDPGKPTARNRPSAQGRRS